MTPRGKETSPVARLARFIDQTVLRPLPPEEVVRRYREAAAERFAAFVTHACYLPALARHAVRSQTVLAAVIDFPFGLSPTRDKIRMIRQAVGYGAREVDIVANLSDAAAGRFEALERELSAIEKASRLIIRKVIIETAFRDDRSMAVLASLIARAGLEFVKTSTGYAPSGARARDVRLLVAAAGNACAVKASGGIGNLRSCMSMLSSGARRIGTSRGLEIMAEAREASPRTISRLNNLLASMPVS